VIWAKQVKFPRARIDVRGRRAIAAQADAADKILYVGKAKNLRQRLGNYRIVEQQNIMASYDGTSARTNRLNQPRPVRLVLELWQ
jgi:hypothetical protein